MKEIIADKESDLLRASPFLNPTEFEKFIANPMTFYDEEGKKNKKIKNWKIKKLINFLIT